MTDTVHTTREATIRSQTLTGLKLLRKHERDAHFCFGVAWATLNMILRELGEEQQEMPEHNSSDDPRSQS